MFCVSIKFLELNLKNKEVKLEDLTNLEKVVMSALSIRKKEEFRQINQKQLDKHTEEIINSLSASDLIHHAIEVYDRTINHFNSDPHITEGVVDELLVFMQKLNRDACICDLGCGNGRDTLFMATKSQKLRKQLMQRIYQGERVIDKFAVPRKKLRVIALDRSKEMLKATAKIIAKYAKTIDPKYFPAIIQRDMHNLSSSCSEIFDGIWSCASLLVHTPKQMIYSSLKAVIDLLKPNGKFSLSYIQEQIPGKYNKLLISSTGNVKYFSQPDPRLIRKIAKECGLKERYFRITDFEIKGKLIQKDFFANHIFEKTK